MQFLDLENEHDLAVKFMQKAQDNKIMAEMVAKEKEYKRQIADLEDKVRNLQQTLQKRSWSFHKGDKK